MSNLFWLNVIIWVISPIYIWSVYKLGKQLPPDYGLMLLMGGSLYIDQTKGEQDADSCKPCDHL